MGRREQNRNAAARPTIPPATIPGRETAFCAPISWSRGRLHTSIERRYKPDRRILCKAEFRMTASALSQPFDDIRRLIAAMPGPDADAVAAVARRATRS